jgi:hypothetical protein
VAACIPRQPPTGIDYSNMIHDVHQKYYYLFPKLPVDLWWERKTKFEYPEKQSRELLNFCRQEE